MSTSRKSPSHNQATPIERNFVCGCSGCLGPNAMCGNIVVSTKLCGAADDDECEYKVVRVIGINDVGE